MQYALTIFIFCLAQFIFGQKEDSLLLVIDQVEISSISSHDEIRTYFNDVSSLSLGIRNTKFKMINEFGFRSAQHDSVLLVEETINDFLLLKMREYLSLHPYPQRIEGDTILIEESDGEITDGLIYVEVDAIGSRTAIKIFVNASATNENLDLKKLYFPIFYQAFQQGDIYSGDLWNLLYGMYKQEKNEEYLELELAEEQQIEVMIDALLLERKE